MILVGVNVAVNIWFLADPGNWRSLENNIGPVRAVYVFVLGTSLAVYGLSRILPASLMLLISGVVPIALANQNRAGFSSLALASAAPLITGALYLASAAITNATPPTEHQRSQPNLSTPPGQNPKSAAQDFDAPASPRRHRWRDLGNSALSTYTMLSQKVISTRGGTTHKRTHAHPVRSPI